MNLPTSWTPKEYFIKFRTEMPIEQGNKYMRWLKGQYPHCDLHHLLGSTLGMKYTGYLIVPISHDEHMKVAEKFKPLFFMAYLPTAVKLLIKYVIYLEGGK